MLAFNLWFVEDSQQLLFSIINYCIHKLFRDKGCNQIFVHWLVEVEAVPEAHYHLQFVVLLISP